jgi:hypothetical protein
LAAAELEIVLGARLGADSSAGSTTGADFVDSMGMAIVSPQDGHSISVPAPELSTASSWLQLGQSKIMSISRKRVK